MFCVVVLTVLALNNKWHSYCKVKHEKKKTTILNNLQKEFVYDTGSS
jgi:hypothetical protein